MNICFPVPKNPYKLYHPLFASIANAGCILNTFFQYLFPAIFSRKQQLITVTRKEKLLEPEPLSENYQLRFGPHRYSLRVSDSAVGFRNHIAGIRCNRLENLQCSCTTVRLCHDHFEPAADTILPRWISTTVLRISDTCQIGSVLLWPYRGRGHTAAGRKVDRLHIYHHPCQHWPW